MGKIGIKKLIEIDKSLVTKLKILSAFENLSVKSLMEKAIKDFVEKKEIERVNNLSQEEKEDLGLLLLMQQTDMSETVSRDEIMDILDAK